MSAYIDPALVEHHLMRLAEFGACHGTGVCRAVYTPEWVHAQQQYAAWCAAAGLHVRWDAVGNVWGRLAGESNAPAIVTGSHVDSQLPGGRYDGALGVVGGLIAVMALKEQYGVPARPLECVSLCEEEGSRFPGTNFWGSRAVTGVARSSEADALVDEQGITLAGAMRTVGLDSSHLAEAARDDIGAFVELHIEQGPLLEEAGLPVAIVTAITGLRQYAVELVGRSDHAGAAPMDWRRDPMAGAAEIIQGVIQTAADRGRPAVTTVGRIEARPGGSAIVPESVLFTVDVRHPDPFALRELCAQHEALFAAVAARRGLALNVKRVLDLEPCPADDHVRATLTSAADSVGVRTLQMHSGAGHDSQVMGKRYPMGMLFVQSKGGRSHTPAEYTTIEDAVAGITVLAEGLHRLAYAAS